MQRGFHLKQALRLLFSRERHEASALPTLSPNVRIVLVDKLADVENALVHLKGHDVLGFDTETKPQFAKGLPQNRPCLVQLASNTHAVLFRLNHMDWQIPDGVARLLESPCVAKVGAGVLADVSMLSGAFGVQANNLVDLSDAGKALRCQFPGLSGLVAGFLGHSLSKTARTSNWEAPVLKPGQLKYAAIDAWVGQRLYFEMSRQRLNLLNFLEARPSLLEEAVRTKRQEVEIAEHLLREALSALELTLSEDCENVLTSGFLCQLTVKGRKGDQVATARLVSKAGPDAVRARCINSLLARIARLYPEHSVVTSLPVPPNAGLDARLWSELCEFVRTNKNPHPVDPGLEQRLDLAPFPGNAT